MSNEARVYSCAGRTSPLHCHVEPGRAMVAQNRLIEPNQLTWFEVAKRIAIGRPQQTRGKGSTAERENPRQGRGTGPAQSENEQCDGSGSWPTTSLIPGFRGDSSDYPRFRTITFAGANLAALTEEACASAANTSSAMSAPSECDRILCTLGSDSMPSRAHPNGG